jgi:hypothetical protein
MSPPTATVTGIVTITQEDRLRVLDESGRGYLFVLGKRIWVSSRHLASLARERRRVTVTFVGEPDMGAVVTRLTIHP